MKTWVVSSEVRILVSFKTEKCHVTVFCFTPGYGTASDGPHQLAVCLVLWQGCDLPAEDGMHLEFWELFRGH